MDYCDALLRIVFWVSLTVCVMSLPLVAWALYQMRRLRQPQMSASWWRAQRRAGR